jgi:hypothetical protein
MELNTDDVFGLLRSYSRHRDFVRAALARIVNDIEQRAIVHDASKMLDDEFAGFSRINAAARINKFGSPEYKEGMVREKPTIDLHFSRNSHHPERPELLAGKETEPDDYAYWSKKAAVDMTFLDVIEMVCDWHGARKGYDDPRSWEDTVKLNFESKGKYLAPEQRWLAEQVARFLEPFS